MWRALREAPFAFSVKLRVHSVKLCVELLAYLSEPQQAVMSSVTVRQFRRPRN